MQLERFDYQTYEGLITRLRETHENLLFGDLAYTDPDASIYLLRHDVDLSPEAALDLAKLEADLGVRATYFLLVSGELYNLHSERYCRVPAQLVDMGHEVGLHYDLRVYDRWSDARRGYETERAALAALSGRPVTAIALHEPSLSGPDLFPDEPEVVNAYTAIDTYRLTYLSDSCGAWRDEAVRILEEEQFPRRIQLLVHPFFWAKRSGDRWERLQTLLDARKAACDAWASRVRAIWSQHDAVQQHDGRVAQLAASDLRGRS